MTGSVIYRLRPMLNVMLESVLAFDAADTPAGAVERTRSFTLSPGLRGGWKVAEHAEVILGVAVPITRSEGESSAGVLGYFSYELPFKK